MQCGEEGHFAHEYPNPGTSIEDGWPSPVDYMLPDASVDKTKLFRSIEAAINFDRYDDITVEITGSNKKKYKSGCHSFGVADLTGTLL